MSWAIGTYTAWAVVAAAAVALWWLTSTSHTLAGRRVARPGALVRGLLRRPFFRLVVVVGWMWVGWHLFAR